MLLSQTKIYPHSNIVIHFSSIPQMFLEHLLNVKAMLDNGCNVNEIKCSSWELLGDIDH